MVGEKEPGAQGVGLREENGQKEPGVQGTGAPEAQKKEVGQGTHVSWRMRLLPASPMYMVPDETP